MKKPWRLSFALFNIVLVLAVLAWLASRVFAPSGMHMELTSDLSTVKAGDWVELRYRILDENGEVMTDFEREYEKLMHLIVVREDLSHFQHLHPELNKETGEFSVSLKFPENGPYSLYSDFTPVYLPQTVVSTQVKIGEVEDFTPETFNVSALTPFEMDGFLITPSFPETLTTGEEMSFSFEVEADDKAVTLEDFLGAKGHCVVLRSETLDYLHTHAEMDKLSFSTVFEEPGLYQSFTQFQVDGQVYTLPFAFEVSGESVQIEDVIIQDASEMDH